MSAPSADVTDCIENRTFDEIEVGDQASLVRTLCQRDIELFAAMSGDVNPAHMDPAYARTDMFHRVVAHGMWGGALISTVLGTELPGPGTIYLSQDLHFEAPIGVGDTVTITVTVWEKIVGRQHIIFDCRGRNQKGEDVIVGTAEVKAPLEKVLRPRIELPEVRFGSHARFNELMARATPGAAIPTAVVHPCDDVSLGAALEAARAGLIIPILVGPSAKIHAAARQAGLDITALRLVDMPHSHAAAAAAVALVRDGEARLLMKGALHTDELMHAVIAADSGLRTERRLSHVYLFDVPGYARPLLVTDAAINIAPSLTDKRDIIQNAIDLARIMGITAPRVAVLSAVEAVNPAFPRPSMPPRCARWPSVARSLAVWSTVRWLSTMRSALRRRVRKASSRRWPDLPTSCWCRIWSRATCWPPAQLPRRCRCRWRGDGPTRTDHPDQSRRLGTHAGCLLRGGGTGLTRPRSRSAHAGELSMSQAILSLNAGSSSIKFAIHDVADLGSGRRLAHGQIEGIGARRIAWRGTRTVRC